MIGETTDRLYWIPELIGFLFHFCEPLLGESIFVFQFQHFNHFLTRNRVRIVFTSPGAFKCRIVSIVNEHRLSQLYFGRTIVLLAVPATAPHHHHRVTTRGSAVTER